MCFVVARRWRVLCCVLFWVSAVWSGLMAAASLRLVGRVQNADQGGLSLYCTIIPLAGVCLCPVNSRAFTETTSKPLTAFLFRSPADQRLDRSAKPLRLASTWSPVPSWLGTKARAPCEQMRSCLPPNPVRSFCLVQRCATQGYNFVHSVQ